MQGIVGGQRKSKIKVDSRGPVMRVVRWPRKVTMGFHTDILTADVGEAQDIADSESPAANRRGFTFTGFDRVQVCTLLSLIESGSWDTHFDRHLDNIDVVRSSADDWPVVSVIRPEQVEQLAAVASFEDAEFEKLADLWAATEEFEGWTQSDVRDLLRELADLADSARLECKSILIWQSP